MQNHVQAFHTNLIYFITRFLRIRIDSSAYEVNDGMITTVWDTKLPVRDGALNKATKSVELPYLEYYL